MFLNDDTRICELRTTLNCHAATFQFIKVFNRLIEDIQNEIEYNLDSPLR